MLNCKKITERASEYLDQDLTPMERIQFKMHLLMCRHCRRFMNQMQFTISTVKQLKDPEPSSQEIADLTDKLIQHHKNSP